MHPSITFLLGLMASIASAMPAPPQAQNASISAPPPSPVSSGTLSDPNGGTPPSGTPTNPNGGTPPSALPTNPNGGEPPSTGLGDVYTFYSGDGTTDQGWPDQNSWVDYETMWNNNQALIFGSCEQFGQADDSSDEIAAIKSAIDSVSSESSVDPRFVMAIVMQESKGCVRVPTTNFGVRNPGLMQDHNGSGTCNDGGNVQDPCPDDQITQMVTDGVGGTSDGDGLIQCLQQADASDVSQYYKAARIYNSGAIDSSGDLGAGIATHCYSSDVANRLTGWVNAASTCTLDSN